MGHSNPAESMPLAARRPKAPLSGSALVPGDKSISHRALILGALAEGRTEVEGLLEGEDVRRTAAAMAAMGAGVERRGPGSWVIDGVGGAGLSEPESVLDLGNSGTSARLLCGLLASRPFFSVMTGDASLNRRPMGRAMAPLRDMGAVFAGRSGDRLPLAISGSAALKPITYRLPVASAQVKSALLLAALNTAGVTTVIEPVATRDHSERMLPAFGAALEIEPRADGRHIALRGPVVLRAPAEVLHVPADPSSAAFPLVAALLVAGSEVRLPGVGVNPLRAGLFAVLEEMGADLAFENPRDIAGEPAADLLARGSSLRGVTVAAARAPSMIDEYPVLAVAAACAEGVTVMEGLGELRVKESDRLAMIADGLTACGVKVEAGEDRLVVHGCGGPPPGGATVRTALDHRIAMSFLVLGLATRQPVAVDDAAPIATSFPEFMDLMRSLGADMASP